MFNDELGFRLAGSLSNEPGDGFIRDCKVMPPLCKHHKKIKFIPMEDNKYYTPSIEEFHVGFEYEYVNSKTEGWTNTTFIRGRGFVEPYGDGEVRVKKLDQEDIESLGWELESSHSGTRFMYEKNIKDFRKIGRAHV